MVTCILSWRAGWAGGPVRPCTRWVWTLRRVNVAGRHAVGKCVWRHAGGARARAFRAGRRRVVWTFRRLPAVARGGWVAVGPVRSCRWSTEMLCHVHGGAGSRGGWAGAGRRHRRPTDVWRPGNRYPRTSHFSGRKLWAETRRVGCGLPPGCGGTRGRTRVPQTPDSGYVHNLTIPRATLLLTLIQPTIACLCWPPWRAYIVKHKVSSSSSMICFRRRHGSLTQHTAHVYPTHSTVNSQPSAYPQR